MKKWTFKLTSNDRDCGECHACERTVRSSEDKKDLNKKLAVITGQVRGISQMISDDAHNMEVLTQIRAAQRGLRRVGIDLIVSQLQTALTAGNKKRAQELVELLSKIDL